MNFITSKFNHLFRISKVLNSIRFSSVAARIPEQDPRNHNFNHVGKFYQISDDDFSGCFEYQIKSEFSRLLRVFRDKSILVRKEAIEIIDYIRSSDHSQPIVRYVLYGGIGVGKTVSMAHVSHYAFAQGNWLLVYFGDLFSMLHFSPEMTTNNQNEEMFDIPTMAASWLQSFLNINAKFLAKYDPKLLKRIDWNQKEYLDEGTSWKDMINFAVGRQKYACDCIGILLREARLHACLGDFKVLGVIRGINCLYGNSRRCDLSATYIRADRISVLAYLRRFCRNDWHNGAIVSSVNLDSVYSLKRDQSHFPRHLLGDDGFKSLDPFVPVSVGNYSEAEVANYLSFLAENRWLTVEAARDADMSGRREIAFLADNRPQELFNVTLEW